MTVPYLFVGEDTMGSVLCILSPTPYEVEFISNILEKHNVFCKFLRKSSPYKVD
jgi:hypothetical protein